MKKKNIILGIFVFLGIFGLAGFSKAATYYVATNGNNGRSKAQAQSISTPWLTINKAMGEISGGDTIEVRGGTYTLSSEINFTASHSGSAGNRTKLKAYNNEPVWLDASGEPNYYVMHFDSGANYITVNGINMRDHPSHDLIHMDGNSYITIKNLEGYNSGDKGIQITSGDNILIESCNFHHNYIGGNCDHCTDLTIENSQFSNNQGDNPNDTAADGFAVEDGDGITIETSTAANNAGDGFDVKADGATYDRCLAANNVREGLKQWGMNSVIKNSIAYGNKFTGVVLERGGSYTMVNNTVVGNGFVDDETINYGMYVAYDGGPNVSLWMANNVFAYNASSVYLGYVDLQYEGYNIYYSREDNELATMSLGNYSRDDIDTGVWKNSGPNRGDGTIAVDPQFSNKDAYNYYPASLSSPMVDAGTLANAPSLDYNGLCRPQGSAIDIGAYEYDQGTNCEEEEDEINLDDGSEGVVYEIDDVKVEFKQLPLNPSKYYLKIKKFNKYPKKIRKKRNLKLYWRIKTNLYKYTRKVKAAKKKIKKYRARLKIVKKKSKKRSLRKKIKKLKKWKHFKVKLVFNYDQKKMKKRIKKKKLKLKFYNKKKGWVNLKAKHNRKKNYFRVNSRKFLYLKNLYTIGLVTAGL